MAQDIGTAIQQEAQKLVVRHERYAKRLHEDFLRRERRTGVHVDPIVYRPAYWQASAGFNPYLVRGRADRIAHSIQRSLQRRDYSPRPAVFYEVPKGDDSTRKVSVFQVADSAVSRMVFRRLLAKNRTRLCAYSFAYRSDLTVHDAIQHIAGDIRGRTRAFVAEYDFREYFDSIYHDHIWRIIRDQRYLLTDVEESVIRAFLRAPTLPLDEYDEESTNHRDRGVPQGTSISLFLANVAASPLDRALERLGVGFARYADDTLIWSHDYARICEAAEALNQAAQAIGADLNLSKSEGVSILTPEGAPAEFKHKDKVEFVGYGFAEDRVSIRDSSIRKMREHLAYLIYANLVQEPARNVIVPARFAPKVDRDYVVMIRQIRRYLYGDLNENKLSRYLARSIPRIHYKGRMAFYPLVDDIEQLRAFDGWLLHTVHTSLRRRGNLLKAAGYSDLPLPHGLSKAELLTFRGETTDGTILDLRLPSATRMSRLLRRASMFYGPNAIGHRASNQYYRGV